MALEPQMLWFRTLGQIVRLTVIPEIQARVDKGQLRESSLPYEVYCLRMLNYTESGKNVTTVELNEEVQILTETKVRRPPIQAGELVTMADIDPEYFFVRPQEVNGKPVAYFICMRSFLEFLFVFDFGPNAPGDIEHAIEGPKFSYPISDLLRKKTFCDTVKPTEKLELLSQHNWPPAPGYFPLIFARLHQDPNLVTDPCFHEVVGQAYTRDYWDQRLAFWTETNMFGPRLKYVRTAVDRHFAGDYISSVYVIVPQFEGIIKEYLRECSLEPEEKC